METWRDEENWGEWRERHVNGFDGHIIEAIDPPEPRQTRGV